MIRKALSITPLLYNSVFLTNNVYFWAIVIGFWVYYGVTHDVSGIDGWFITMNWVNIAVAAIQVYFGYKSMSNANHMHHAAS